MRCTWENLYKVILNNFDIPVPTDAEERIKKVLNSDYFTNRERYLMNERWGNHRTFSSIASDLNISSTRVGQIEKNIIKLCSQKEFIQCLTDDDWRNISLQKSARVMPQHIVDAKEMAKGLIALCVRNNTVLEKYHSMQVPITDERMKELMIDCVNNAFFVLMNLCSDNNSTKENMKNVLKHEAMLYTQNWNEPEMPEWIIKINELYKQQNKSTI